jgi:hypothetical protein
MPIYIHEPNPLTGRRPTGYPVADFMYIPEGDRLIVRLIPFTEDWSGYHWVDPMSEEQWDALREILATEPHFSGTRVTGEVTLSYSQGQDFDSFDRAVIELAAVMTDDGSVIYLQQLTDGWRWV